MCGLQKGGRHRRGRRVVICLLGWGGEGRLGGLCASDVGGGQDKRAQAQGPNGHCGVKKALGLQPRSPIWGSEAVMGLQEHQKGRREKGPPGTRRKSQTYLGGTGHFFRNTHIHTHTHTPRPGISSVSHTHTHSRTPGWPRGAPVRPPHGAPCYSHHSPSARERISDTVLRMVGIAAAAAGGSSARTLHLSRRLAGWGTGCAARSV